MWQVPYQYDRLGILCEVERTYSLTLKMMIDIEPKLELSFVYNLNNLSLCILCIPLLRCPNEDAGISVLERLAFLLSSGEEERFIRLGVRKIDGDEVIYADGVVFAPEKKVCFTWLYFELRARHPKDTLRYKVNCTAVRRRREAH